MKSQLQCWLACSGSRLIREGKRFLPLRGRFMRSSQYTRQRTVLLHGFRWWRALSHSSPKLHSAPKRNDGKNGVFGVDPHRRVSA